LDPNQIQPYHANPRKNQRSIDKVANSIERYGFQQPIVVDKNNIVIVGHTRLKAAKKLGLQKVPVVTATDLDEEKVRAYRIMDNRAAEESQWDTDLLFAELEALMKNSNLQDLSIQTGFRESELNKLFKMQEEPDLTKYDNNEIFHTKTGDVWHLGSHRLVCGDSTDPECFKKLMADDRIDMVWQDPPYGIAYETANGINYTPAENELRNHIIANDTLGEQGLLNLLQRQLEQILRYLRPGGPVYFCHDIRFNSRIHDLLEHNDIHVADTLIWKKNKHSTWLSDYAKFYEPIFYGWRRGAAHPWHARGITPNTLDIETLDQMDEKQLRSLLKGIITNYQEFDKESRRIASLHPTVKPVKLIAYHLINSSQPGEIVFDGFAGSGSTLIAAERTNRIARCIEFEPKFCDTIIRRWQDESGQRAKSATGQDFPGQ